MQFTRNLKHIFAIWLIVLITVFTVAGLGYTDFLRDITHRLIYREVGSFSWLYKYNFTKSTDIIILKIDDYTLDSLQSRTDQRMLGVPKSVYIDLIEKLESVGAKGIGIDIIFQNRDPDEEKFADILKKYRNVTIATTPNICTPFNTPKEVLQKINEQREITLTNSRKTLSGSNNIIGKMKDESSSQVGVKIETFCDINYHKSILERKVNAGEFKSALGTCVQDENGPYKSCTGIPRSVYNDANWGLVQMDASRDRKMSYFTIYSGALLSEDKYIPTLGAALYTGSYALGHDVEMLQPFFGPPQSYLSTSLINILNASKLDLIANGYANKYFFIGESSSQAQDQHISPVTGTLMDGVEFHAHTLDGLLQKRVLKERNINDGIYIFGLLTISLLFSLLYLFLPKYISPFIAIMAVLLTIFIGRYVYFQFALVLDVTPIILAVGLFSFPVTFIYRFFIIDREKRMITSAFAHYVDPTLVHEIAERSGEINLGGESRELSILFSDIAGFTTISERLAPMDLFSLMSSYLTRMTGILTSHGGTLDKYIGDAVMGFFGAPLTLADHAKHACATALAMRDALPEFNADITSRGLAPVDFRVGIATGEVMVGNIGSYDRWNYTVLGDTVNLASRLEATSKEYGTHIIIAGPTYEQVKDEYYARPLDKVAVKGKTEGVMIYELIGKHTDPTIDHTKYENYAHALDLYFVGQYLEAGQLFEKNMTDDAPSRVMAMRCVDILKGVVVVEGGVYKMTHK